MVDVARLRIEADSRQVKTASGDLDRLSTSARKAANSSDVLNRTTISLSHVYRELAAVMGTLKFLDTIRQTIELNQRYKELGIAMEVVGRNVGISSQQLNTATAALEKMGISMIEARQTVTRLAASHIDLANAEKLADLARNAAIVGQINTSQALDRIVHGIRSAEVEVLKTIGITVQFDQAYKQLAAQLDKTTKELTQQEKQQARVNVVLDQAPALVGLYEAAMNNAGKQFRSTERLAENLKIKIGELFDETTSLAVRSYTNLLKDLDDTFTDLTDSGELQNWSDNIADTFAFLGDAARAALSPVIILLRTVDAAIDRGKALLSGDFEKSRQIGLDYEKFINAELKTFLNSTKLRDELQKQRVERDLLTDAVGRGASAIETEAQKINESIESTKKIKDERKKFIAALAKQAAEAGKSRIEIQRMEADLLGVSDAAEKYLKIIEDQAIAEEDLRISRQKQEEELKRIEQITQSVKTKQEIYNETIEELDYLLTNGLGLAAYNKALARAQEELEKTENVAESSFLNVEQFGIQAARNLQSEFANFLAGFETNFSQTIKRMAAELASSALLKQISGLSTGTGALGNTAFGYGASGDVLGGFIAGGYTDSASRLASAGNYLRSNANPTYGAIAYTGASAVGSSAITTGVATALATFGGPYGALAAAVVIALDVLDKNFGNHEISSGLKPVAKLSSAIFNPVFGADYSGQQFEKLLGVNFVSKISPGNVLESIGLKTPESLLERAFFGRDIPKFQGESLVGSVTAGGFEGVLNQAFREKGSVFKSSRTSNFIVDTDTGQILNQFGRLSESGNIRGDLRDAATQPAIDRALEIGEFLDKTFADISTAISETADRFGLSKDALNAVSVELDLMSEKGEAFTQEQIAEQIAHVSDEMVRGLIPTVDDLARIGESASQALSRFNADFQAVESAFIITGESAADALAKTQALSLEQRSAVTDRFGGAAGLQAELQSFFSNVLNESQQLEIVETRLTDVLQKAGIDFIPTIDQLVNAFQNGTPAVKALVLENDELITQYHALKGSVEGIGDVTGDVAENLTGEMQALANERRAFTAGRREAHAGDLAPTIATTIGGRIFTEDEIRAMQQAAVDQATATLQNIVKEQLSRLGESYREAQSFIKDQIDAVKEANRFFERLRTDFLEISTSSRAAAHEQLKAAIELAKSGADISLIDTPELTNAIRTLKDDRTDLFSTREAFEMDRASAANKILELSRLGVTRSDETLNTLKDQLDVMKSSFEVQEQMLNAQLRFTGVNDASLLGDQELTGSATGAFNNLIENLAIQAGTSFNGSVRFTNPGSELDAIKSRFTSQFNALVPTSAANFDFSDMAQAIKEMKEELAKIKTSSEKTANVLSTVTRDGRAMQTA